MITFLKMDYSRTVFRFISFFLCNLFTIKIVDFRGFQTRILRVKDHATTRPPPRPIIVNTSSTIDLLDMENPLNRATKCTGFLAHYRSLVFLLAFNLFE